MRGIPGLSAPATTQGLATRWNFGQMNLKTRSREVSERKQVGDAESMINEGWNASGRQGFFGGEGGEV
jgi:pyruvate dehydrogenase kinase 2/3/4